MCCYITLSFSQMLQWPVKLLKLSVNIKLDAYNIFFHNFSLLKIVSVSAFSSTSLAVLVFCYVKTRTSSKIGHMATLTSSFLRLVGNIRKTLAVDIGLMSVKEPGLEVWHVFIFIFFVIRKASSLLLSKLNDTHLCPCHI